MSGPHRGAGAGAGLGLAIGARRPVVFVCHDHMMAEAFATIRAELATLGAEVIEGPPTRPGPKLAYDPADHAALFGRADVAMFSSRSLCPEAIFEAAPRLRGVVVPSTGVETVDVAAASARGILVGHAFSPVTGAALAEATVMLILMQLYNPLRSREVLLGQRQRPGFSPEQRWASLLQGRTVGLVGGLGRIGLEVARRLQPFGVRLLAAVRPGSPGEGQPAPYGIEVVPLETLLALSDIVSLHVTITGQTRNLIDERALARMKPGAYLINTARGEAVDEAALYRALSEGRLAGAALDTFQVEPLPMDSPLRRLDNVFLTPHLVAQTRDSLALLPGIAVENVTRLLRGEPPLYCKNPGAIPAWRERLAALGVPLTTAATATPAAA